MSIVLKKNRSVTASVSYYEDKSAKGTVEVELGVEDQTYGLSKVQSSLGDLKIMMGFVLTHTVEGLPEIQKEFGLKIGDNSYMIFNPEGKMRKARLSKKTLVTPSSVGIYFSGLSYAGFEPNEPQTLLDKEDWSQVAA